MELALSISTNALKAPLTIEQLAVFNVHPDSGFMPPKAPVARLPSSWEPWEKILDAAVAARLQLGDKLGITEEEKATSESWRVNVRRMPLLSSTKLQSSRILLRRAHLVLAYIMHFYIQSLPPDAPVIIPRPLALPVLRISASLDIPPLLTFSDTVLYNWTHRHPSTSVPAIDNLRIRTLFSGLIDEEEFYLSSARIELRGVKALELMRSTMDEVFIRDKTAVCRITGYLQAMTRIINELKVLLMDVRRMCRPEQYYNEVRPWFRGEDSDTNGRKWVFEGIEEDPSLKTPTELSGPSAGQSSLIHVLDVFLGIDHQSSPSGKQSFMTRMQRYMPRNHRLFLDHLISNPQPLRIFVMSSGDDRLCATYNSAVLALKEFRDAHMIIATLYIVNPARRTAMLAKTRNQKDGQPLLGTGGTNLVKFLKDTRARTSAAMITYT
ncbi:hypothetical protein C0989_000725 [Termitomyces sp. Mn162]|nr:hypothetical protein C0989_000725 [Termitomyces sp. Mn162]